MSLPPGFDSVYNQSGTLAYYEEDFWGGYLRGNTNFLKNKELPRRDNLRGVLY